jgi:hypothetical protein
MLNDRINLNEFTPQFLIVDTECLNDYWSFQYRNEEMEETKIIECFNDNDVINFYNEVLKNITRPMYIYAIDYDSTMINVLCKLVEKKETNILRKLRNINNLIMKGFNYFQLNRYFWCDVYFKMKTPNFDEALTKCRYHFASDEIILEFLNNYDILLGKSLVFKNLMFCSIPKMMFYYTIKQDRTMIPSISLKKLQLVEDGYNIKIDFNKYQTIHLIKEDGLYNDWIKYSKNDVDYLFRFFIKNLIPKIKEKYFAIIAANKVKPIYSNDVIYPIKVTNRVIYSENNTDLIVSLLKLDSPNKDIVINYSDFIKTDNKKFNDFVSFVNENQIVDNDKDIKLKYAEKYNVEYIEDDYNRDEELVINSFDKITLNNCNCTFGLGGLHGAVLKLVAEDLLHLDYESQYPSIILQFKELFSQIIDIELYEGIYNLKCYDLKNQIKELKERDKEICKLIEDGIQEHTPELKEINLKLIELNQIMKGTKLILNSSYGLINSNFKLPISNKILGRFICLFGQSLLINLVSKLPKNTPIYNVNTDGLIIKKVLDTIVVESDRYFRLGVDSYNKLIQRDVNNYILDSKKKGCFNVKIKQLINTNEKLSQNLINAINIIENKEVKILPIYFNSKWFDVKEQGYYLTSEEFGKQIIKQTIKPQILGLDGEVFFFTPFAEKADIEMYKKYAEKTKNRIFDFELEKKEVINYFEYRLKKDTSDNIKIKRSTRRNLMKILCSKTIGLSGFKGDLKSDCMLFLNGKQQIIKPLVQYNMTQIVESTDCKALTLYSNNDLVIIDIDIYDKNTGRCKEGWREIEQLLKELKLNTTFEVWNKKTESYNRKFIYRSNEKFNVKNKYFEIISKGVVWSLDSFYSNNEIIPIVLPDSIKKHLV